MDSLEFNLHQLILTDLARTIASSTDVGHDQCDASLNSAINVLSSRVQTRVKMDEERDSSPGTPEEDDATEQNGAEQTRAFMPASRVHCNIAFGELACNVPASHAANSVSVLVDVLQDIAYIDFEKSLQWAEWCLPDQLTYSTVSALLRLTAAHPEHRSTVIDAIVQFSLEIVNQLEGESPVEVITRVAPSFHGLYRAVISTPFPWTLIEWQTLSSQVKGLFTFDLVDRLNSILSDYLASPDSQSPESLLYVQTLLTRYVEEGRPLSGYFLVCSLMEIQGVILGQVIKPPSREKVFIPRRPGHEITEEEEAAAASHAWEALISEPAGSLDIKGGDTEGELKGSIVSAMKCFEDLLAQIEEMDDEPSSETYAYETMAESLKLASLCCVMVQDLDPGLFSRLKLVLSDASPVFDTLVQEAAVGALTVLVHNFPDLATQLVLHLRRFVTAPLPIFEFEFASDARAPPALTAAAKCLALCIKIAPGDDLVISNMYSLLNYIAATSKELSIGSTSTSTYSNQGAGGHNNHPYMQSYDHSTVVSVETGLRGFNEDQKRLIGISTISVVTHLAIEFQDEEVTRLTISMLLQRLQSAEPTVEAAIANNLVDLALQAPSKVFTDIIRAFSMVNRSSNPESPRFSNNMVLAAQTRLAQELGKRPDLYETYLIELLTLFADKGIAVQTRTATSKEREPSHELLDELSALVLPIDALISQKDFKPHDNPSPELVALFRNMWFICVLFRFTDIDDPKSSALLNEWQRAALTRIATKTPPIVLEKAHDYVTSDLEYNPVLRQDYVHMAISQHRATLTKHILLRAAEIKYLSPGQVIFLLTLHDIETLRSSMDLPASLTTYFVNEGMNKSAALASCMDAVAEKVMRGFVASVSRKIMDHTLSIKLSKELRDLLVASTHRIARVRDLASKYLDRLIRAFPSLMCESTLVFSILEVLTLLRWACEGEFTDEYTPRPDFHSNRSDITIHLTDSYAVRNDILEKLHKNATQWFHNAISRAPIEVQAILQRYLGEYQSIALPDAVELGASVALECVTALGPLDRKIPPTSGASVWKPDHSKMFTSQLSARNHYAGEAGGVRLANRGGGNELQKLPPTHAPSMELRALRDKLAAAVKEIQDQTSTLSIHDLKRLLFRCAAVLIATPERDYDLLHYLVVLPFEVFTPPAIAMGIEAWTWVVRERPEAEISLMLEINSAWAGTIRFHKGIFSTSLNFDDPFNHPIEYSPTDQAEIDRSLAAARRLLVPHSLLLHMLTSRFQAVRYRHPGLMMLLLRLILRSSLAHKTLSTHPLARESLFSLFIFGFEALRSSRMDAFSEFRIRESLYRGALSWFAVRPQWSYGASRVQITADIKLLNEFLEAVQNDGTRADHLISSLDEARHTLRVPHYVARQKSLNELLRLLVEKEITRLQVWLNPTNDPKRGSDHLILAERMYTDEQWTQAVDTAWKVDPAIAVHMAERFKPLVISLEVGRRVRHNPQDVLDVPEALKFFVGERLSPMIKQEIKYLLLWAPVPPVLAITYFGPQYDNNPIILQYAHRVLEQHPVDLTFFFVPQVVQALRYDALGYVEKFIFETAKISQLFCHQIIWNMNANFCKGDAGEIPDPMKPMLERMVAMVVASLSGEAREFYDREFGFFQKVTSISGKLKPFIKKSKPEKKAKIDEEMAKIEVDPGVYLPSNPDGVVVDIDKKSGRPLQSHAKAPFMATFKVRKERVEISTDPDSLLDSTAPGRGEKRTEYEVWQQAIFKVGDDCRQDVLALQIIAMFKNIFSRVGLMLYLFPYRVTATAPGCGVIDVVPNSTSRDEMGRAKINDLLGFFVSKYGNADTLEFQKARLHFIQSMAAYSVACYILQIKDRHNGNIMIDGHGHIVHVDFGFLFDIDESLIS
ncbi:phosphatidylinositol-4- kinase [Tulasnella sp. 419]|nr:phosphatidylinositol-4- kinase [Tulasnella sp. 419]